MLDPLNCASKTVAHLTGLSVSGLVGCFFAGQHLNPVLASSMLIGGVVWFKDCSKASRRRRAFLENAINAPSP